MSEKPRTFTIKIDLLPKQIDFINSVKKEVMFSGGVGSSKSVSLCLKAVQQAVIPGNIVVLCRKTLTALKNTTLRPLLYGTGDLQPILPPGSYKYNKSEGKIQLIKGGEIKLLGVDDEFRIRSLEAGCICVDEATELNELEYMELFRRLRLKKTKLRQLCSATNPASPHHFLYKRFFTKDIPGWQNREVITTSSFENFHLPEDYTDSLNTFEGVMHDRFVKGLWVQQEGAIYDNFKEEDCVKKLPKNIVTEWLIGVDAGWTHPTAILKAGVYGDHRMHIFSEFKKSKVIQDEIIKKLEKESNLNPKIIVDPSCASLIGALQNKGLNVQKANNDVANGISRVRTAFKEGRLTIDPDCVELISEVYNYSYEPGTEKPVKTNDDLADSLRYLQNYMDDQVQTYVRPMVYFGQEEEIEDDWKEFKV